MSLSPGLTELNSTELKPWHDVKMILATTAPSRTPFKTKYLDMLEDPTKTEFYPKFDHKL